MSVINVMFLNSILSLADGACPEGKSIGIGENVNKSRALYHH